ncbi:Uncharacterised protein [Vibrio cholerae]|nr:Uncharacterised protein [Vibrio cholerae]
MQNLLNQNTLNTRKVVPCLSIFVMLLMSASAQAVNIEYDFGAGVSADNNHIVGSSDLTYSLRGGGWSLINIIVFWRLTPIQGAAIYQSTSFLMIIFILLALAKHSTF